MKSVEENVEEIVEESASELFVLILETATDDVWKEAAAKVVLIQLPSFNTAAVVPRYFCVVARPPLPWCDE